MGKGGKLWVKMHWPKDQLLLVQLELVQAEKPLVCGLCSIWTLRCGHGQQVRMESLGVVKKEAVWEQ